MPDHAPSPLQTRLAREISGEVLFDRFSRGRYATDASFYQIMPEGVVVPRTMDEALRALAIARDDGRIVTARGGGTSQCGQTVNNGIVIDFSKHLNRILSLDVENRDVRGRARHRARRSQPATEKARAVVSGRRLHGVARHHRRHGRQQFLRRAVFALRHHARQHAVAGCRARGRHADAFRRSAARPRPGERARLRACAVSRHARARRARGGRDRG